MRLTTCNATWKYEVVQLDPVMATKQVRIASITKETIPLGVRMEF